MRMYDIIRKKRDGEVLSDEEIYEVIKEYTKGNIPDYQMSAFCMAVYYKGMNDNETAVLTDAMAKSGDMLDLSFLGENTVDKHSTGGVGDKTTLVVAPLVASLGGIIAKMSGRGLGHTGGTIDKLESIDGFNVEMSSDDFMSTVSNNKIAVIGQSKNLAPADKMLYALRDVTATVDSLPLIASSIMSKKLAAGARSIVLDVKVGSGAFMKNIESARALAEKMTSIGKHNGRNVSAVLTNMDEPLGYCIGNSLEVKEALSVLQGAGPNDLREVCVTLASEMLSLVHGWSNKDSIQRASDALTSGLALQKFREWISSQGGDISFIENTDLLPSCNLVKEVISQHDGYVTSINAEQIGISSAILGAGRQSKTDSIDYGAGIILKKKVGDRIEKGEIIAELYTNNESSFSAAEKMLLDAYDLSENRIPKPQLVLDIIR